MPNNDIRYWRERAEKAEAEVVALQKELAKLKSPRYAISASEDGHSLVLPATTAKEYAESLLSLVPSYHKVTPEEESRVQTLAKALVDFDDKFSEDIDLDTEEHPEIGLTYYEIRDELKELMSDLSVCSFSRESVIERYMV